MWHKKFDASEVPEYIEGNAYSNKDLELMAELLLREDARREQCRSCNQFGTETGEFRVKDMVDKEGNPVVDEEGAQLKIKYPEYICPDQHKWFKGEGKAKGTKGENPILFEEHIIQRKRREIASSTGDIDPSIVRGIYWRAYPLGGRQINSKEDRAKRGLGYYR